MPRLFPEMLELGRPARLEPVLRRTMASEAIEYCCCMLNRMIYERFPQRLHYGEFRDWREEFFDAAAFLFDIAICRGLPEEPTNSVCVAFNALLDSETVHNVHGGHAPWMDWFTVHYGNEFIYQLFDSDHAETANPTNDPELAEAFFRAHTLLVRIDKIRRWQEEPVSTYILDIMPKAIRLSLESAFDYTTAAHDRPWLHVTEQYAVYRYRLADALGNSDKTLSNYEKDGKTPKGTLWPSPLNPNDKHNKKYYDPLKVLEALTALPKDFSKHTPVADIIAALMNNKFASKIVPKQPKKPIAEDGS